MQVTIETPDADGIHTVLLSMKDDGLMARLEGYFGPSLRMPACSEEDLLEEIAMREGRVAVLAHVFVDVDRRRQGLGTALVSRFVAEMRARSVSAIYLRAAPPEGFLDHTTGTLQPGMNLVAWYEAFGFQVLESHAGGPDTLMVLDPL